MKIYLYGTIPKQDAESWDPQGLKADIDGERAEVELLVHQGVGFLYSRVDLGGKLKATRKNVQAHSETLGELLDLTSTLAPVSFGAIVDDLKAVKKISSENKEILEDTLEKINHKVEYGVKTYWDPDVVAREIGETDRKVQKLKKKVQKGKVGDQYQATVEVGELIDDKIETKKEELRNTMLEYLTPVSDEWTSNEIFDERMAANLAFLLDRSSQDDFDKAMDSLGKSQPGYLTFKFSGPWPPFNFVDLELR
ncbi:GvpL/GvpF family gas vesicle protein [Candidatus Bipolaricaulota bacterium]|nr:GvpL/GvpF family gas vesicle protein [Candidatus Bipolaricaulota bacterium]